MITIRVEGDYLDTVAVDVPEVAADVLVSHVGEKAHVLTHLVVILGLGGAELEVDDNPSIAVGHHTIGAVLADLAVLVLQTIGGRVVDGEYGAFVIESPTV